MNKMPNIKLVVVFVFLICFSSSVISQLNKTQPKPIKKNIGVKKKLNSKTDSNKIVFNKFSLDNGLKVILHQDNSIPIVAITAMYHVGSKNEDSSRAGFANFFKHLLFEGSKYLKRGDFFNYVSSNGGEINANTNFDRTFYYEVLPSNQINLGLWLESERMLEANISQEGIETQLEVVKEEKRQQYDKTPYGTYLPEIFNLAYHVSPYRWIPIGNFDHLNQATLKQFIEFYKTYYVPNNCVLTIAGDIDTSYVKQQVIAYFSDIPRGKYVLTDLKIKEPPLSNEIKKTIENNIQLPAVFMAYRVPSLKSKDYYALNLLSNILTNGNSSRLNMYLVDQKRSANTVDGFPILNEEEGLLVFYAVANPEHSPEELQKDMDTVFNQIARKLISELEFEKVKNQYETQLITRRNSMLGIAESLSKNELFLGNAKIINSELKSIKSVTRQDILNLAKRYLKNNNRVVLYYVPKTNKN